jgi:anhydro-N-acetylmuramic acid kinase
MAGLHGQTIFHHPDPSSPATLQIGEPTYLAAKLGAPVVSNFRAADMAAGGQGAPLATAFHVRIFGRRGQHVCVNNLGGISNVTSIDWRTGRVPGVVAFDTGPANMLIDIAVRHFSGGRKSCDRDGLWAARGRIAEPLLRRWLRHPFFRKAPPKSTGREMFGDSFFQHALAEAQRARLSKFDLVATLTELTARSLVESYGIHLGSFPDVVILSGGGARNPSMVSAIQRSFVSHGASVKLMDSAALGWPLSGLEPAAFAWLAWLRIRGLPGNHPETTGATRPVLCGQLTAP